MFAAVDGTASKSRKLYLVIGPFLVAFFVGAVGANRLAAAQGARGAETGGSEQEYILAVPPFLPAERLDLTFGHMAKRFGEILGRDVHFRTSTTFERYSQNVLGERYDFAQIPPFVFVRLDPRTYVTLGRPPGTMRLDLVVKEDSPFEQVRDLAGKTVAVHPKAWGAEELAVSAFLEGGLDPERDMNLVYLEQALSCLQQLVAQTASACLTNSFAHQRFAEQYRVRFRVIGHTIEVPFGPFVAHRRVPEAERNAIRDLLATWHEDPRNTNPNPVSGAKVPSFVPVTPGDYDAVLELSKRGDAEPRDFDP